MKKYIIITIIILHFSIISCSRVEILSDPYWNTLISDFNGKAAGIKFQAFIHGKKLKLTVVDVTGDIPDLEKYTDSMSEIYLISPLLSRSISSLGKVKGPGVFYYFGSINKNVIESSDNLVVIERDRNKAFFDAGMLAAKEIIDDSFLSIVYDVDNSALKKEAMSFLDGVMKSGKKIDTVSLEVHSVTSESEIRSFFNRDKVKNSPHIVIFIDKWKNICYELSERDNKKIITSDSWFYKTYGSFIVFSIEDDIKGMLNKVYSNVNKGKHTDITLDGVISR